MDRNVFVRLKRKNKGLMATSVIDDVWTNADKVNWFKVTRVMEITHEAIRPIVETEITNFHDDIRSKFGHGSLCGSCRSINASNCPSRICSDITSQIESVHRYSRHCYKNSNITQWLSDPWEIAKCYMSRSKDLEGKPESDIDFRSVLNVVINNTRFQRFNTAVDMTNDNNIFCKGRNARAEVMHSRSNQMTAHYLNHYCDLFIDIVNTIGTDKAEFVGKIEKVRDTPLSINAEDIVKLKQQAAMYQVLAEVELRSEEITNGMMATSVIDDLWNNADKVNWLKVIRIMEFTDEAIRPFVETEITNFHDEIRSKFRHESTCGSCRSTNASNCPSGICSNITSQIESVHRYSRPCYKNSNIKQWLSDPWEIAKCYMSRRTDLEGKTGSDVDFPSVLNVVINNTRFQRRITAVDMTKMNNIFCKGRNAKAKVMHLRSHQMTAQDLNLYCDLFIDIVNTIGTDKAECVGKIEKVRDTPLSITAEDIVKLKQQAAMYQVLAEVELKRTRRKEIEKEKRSDKKRYRIKTIKQWDDAIIEKDEDAIGELLTAGNLPNSSQLGDAFKVFGRESGAMTRICRVVSHRILNRSKFQIVRVEAAYESPGEDDVTFIVYLKQPQTDLNFADLEFKVVERVIGQYSSEGKDIADREVREHLEFTLEEANRLRTCLEKHSEPLMKKHSNLQIISASHFKSKKFGNENLMCVVLYVRVKGFIPLTEELLPDKLDEIPTDIREGGFEFLSNAGESHAHLKMGCGITGSKGIGTIGPFLKAKGKTYCLTAAHVLVDLPDANTTSVHAGHAGQDPICVYQPNPTRSKSFGCVDYFKYSKGGGKVPGIDAAAILITDESRLPNSGEFPKSAIIEENAMEVDVDENAVHNLKYISGEICDPKFFEDNTAFEVSKFGAVTGATRGKIHTVGASVRYTLLENSYTWEMHSQIEISGSFGCNAFAFHGDSGAVVLVSNGGSRNDLKAVGLLIGGSSYDRIFATPMYAILKEFDIDSSHVMAFQTSAIRSQVDALNTHVQSLNSLVVQLENGSLSLNTNFESLNTNFDSLNTNFDSLNTKVESLVGDMMQTMQMMQTMASNN